MRERHLDGLRGWAALVVVVTHTIGGVLLPHWRPRIQPLFTDGGLAVGIFFALSGYVLTVAFFKIPSRRILADLALRRYPRLTVPILAVSTVAALLMAGELMFNVPAGRLAGSDDWLATFYNFEPSIGHLLKFALVKVYLNGSPAQSYDSSLWTMPIEMIGSLVLFAAMAIAGRAHRAQWAVIALLVAAALALRSMFLAMALGVAVARLGQSDLHRAIVRHPAATALARSLLLGALVAAALRSRSQEPLVLPICSVLVLYAVLLDPALQRALESRLSQWLGRLSFSLYLVHVLVICSASAWLYLRLAGKGPLGLAGAMAVFVTTIAGSLLAAMAFHPLERLGIVSGRNFSAWCLAGTATRSLSASAD